MSTGTSFPKGGGDACGRLEVGPPWAVGQSGTGRTGMWGSGSLTRAVKALGAVGRKGDTQPRQGKDSVGTF